MSRSAYSSGFCWTCGERVSTAGFASHKHKMMHVRQGLLTRSIRYTRRYGRDVRFEHTDKRLKRTFYFVYRQPETAFFKLTGYLVREIPALSKDMEPPEKIESPFRRFDLLADIREYYGGVTIHRSHPSFYNHRTLALYDWDVLREEWAKENYYGWFIHDEIYDVRKPDGAD